MIDTRRVQITTQPDEEPVSLIEAKEHLHITHDEEDAYISGLIVAARVYAEMVSRRAYVTRTYTAVLDRWPYWTRIELPYPPLMAVTEFAYTDDQDVRTVWESNNYWVDAHSEPGRIALRSTATWPSVTLKEINAIEIIYTAGYGLASDVPDTYKAAVKLMIGHLYENREAVTTAQGISVVVTPLGLDALLLTDRGGW
jgi:uncharacterized phiE125 gp8 family phage protein